MRTITTTAVALVLGCATAGGAAAGTTELVSSGEYEGGQSPLAISGDGRFVTFIKGTCGPGGCGSNGVVADLRKGTFVEVCFGGVDGWVQAISRDGRLVLCGAFEPFTQQDAVSVADPQTGNDTPVAVASDGGELDGDANADALSASGRYAVFDSDATNLVRDDTNGKMDVFVRDMKLGKTVRVSVGPHGRQGNGDSAGGSVSGDGRYIVFYSAASNLVAGDANGKVDVFLRDRQLGTTERISIATDGKQANGDSGNFRVPCPDANCGLTLAGGFVSDNGNIVVFSSAATNLVPGDHNGKTDVFVRDRQAGTTTRISRAWNGGEANGDSYATSLSADGRFVVFQSDATNIVPGDTNKAQDVFVYDRQTRKAERVSVSSAGKQGNGPSGIGAISADGKVVAFVSDASNLAPHDTNNFVDTFVRVR